MSEVWPTRGVRILIILGSLVILAAGLRAAAPIVVPLLLAVFLALLTSPPITWLTRRGVNLWVAIGIAVTVLFGAMALVGFVFASSLTELANSLPQYQSRFEALVGELDAWGQRHHIDLSTKALQELLNPSVAVGFLGSFVAELGSLLTTALLVFVIAILLIADAVAVPQRLQQVNRDPGAALDYVARVRRDVDHYVGILSLVSLATAILVYVLLLAVGVQFALLWALLAFLLNFIPNVGSVVATVPAVVMAYLQIGPGAAVTVFFGYGLINVAMGFFVQPRLMGKDTGLSTLTVMVCLLFWGWLLGPVGMLVSVPLTSVIRLALDANESTRPVAVFLGNEET